ncbi:MAG: sigma-70 family RNA polymerase sigma factor, partial [Acidobacteria bacterium]|nr:sigma-70 family RNA polymerase sigma factor [Acidobacteriota bacterium]
MTTESFRRSSENSLQPGNELESTTALLELARAGDDQAKERLARRYLPILRRWAHGRLPRGARQRLETDDLVQNTLIRAFNRLKEFEPRREGAFLAYLCRILMNQIRDEIRRAKSAPPMEGLAEDIALNGPSPLEDAIGK